MVHCKVFGKAILWTWILLDIESNPQLLRKAWIEGVALAGDEWAELDGSKMWCLRTEVPTGKAGNMLHLFLANRVSSVLVFEKVFKIDKEDPYV